MKRTEPNNTLTKEEVKKPCNEIENRSRCDEDKPFVFVSYSSLDGAQVYPTVTALQEAGYNVWIDKEVIPDHNGKYWHEVALRAIQKRACKCVLFMMSEHSLTSAPVFAEIIKSQEDRKVRHKHRDKPIPLIYVDADANHDLGAGTLDQLITNTFSNNDRKLSSSQISGLRSLKLSMVDDILGDCDGADADENDDTDAGEIAMAFLKLVIDKRRGGGGNRTIVSCDDIATIMRNIPDECRAQTPQSTRVTAYNPISQHVAPSSPDSDHPASMSRSTERKSSVAPEPERMASNTEVIRTTASAGPQPTPTPLMHGASPLGSAMSISPETSPLLVDENSTSSPRDVNLTNARKKESVHDETKLPLMHQYWAAFDEYCSAHEAAKEGGLTPGKHRSSVYDVAFQNVLVRGAHYNYEIKRRANSIQAEVHYTSKRYRGEFERLEAAKSEIAAKLPFDVSWHNEKTYFGIRTGTSAAPTADEQAWDQQFQWFIDTMLQINSVILPLIEEN